MIDDERSKQELLRELTLLRERLHGLESELAGSKRLVKELREHEEDYREFFENAVDPIFVLDERFRYRDVNASAVRVFGYSREEFLSMSVFDVIPPEQVPRSAETFTMLWRRGQYAKFFGKMRTRDGRWLDIEVSSSAIEKHGRIVGSRDIVRDITDRVNAEAALRRTEQRLRDIVEHSTNLFYMHTPDHELTYLSPQTRAFFDCEPDEALVRWTEFLTDNPANRQGIEATQRAIDSGQPQPPYELELRGLQGRVIWVEVREAPIVRDGATVAVVGALIDVTERKKAEAGLRASEEKFRNIFNHATVSIWEEDFSKVKAAIDLLRAQGVTDFTAYIAEHPEFVQEAVRLIRIVDVNETTLRLYGADHKEQLLGSMEKVLTQDALDMMKQVMAAIAEGRSSFEVETTNRTIDGRTFNALVSIAFPTERSAFKNLLVSIMDTTAHKKAEEERKRMEAQLLQAQKMEAMGLLAGGIAHDFNNILSAIIGYANLLQRRMADGDPHRNYVDQVVLAAERAAQLTQSLLAFSRKQVISPKTLNVADVISKIERLLVRVIGEDIDLSVRVADLPLTILADEGQVEQALINLATNARDAMPDGGTLTIEAGRRRMDEESVARQGFGKAGDYALITVTDTGIGMDEQTRERIFEPFFTTKEKGRGTGLGLSIIYGIVSQNNGYISCSSEPGRGSVFRLFFPLVREAAGKAEAPASAVPERGTETVLVAEDDEVLRKLTRTVLEEFGYTVLLAADGEEALQVYREHQGEVHLLLLDVIMPKRDGKSVYEAVRKMHPGARALFMSGYTGDIVIKKGVLGEGINFIAKPTSPSELLKKVREVLDAPPHGQ